MGSRPVRAEPVLPRFAFAAFMIYVEVMFINVKRAEYVCNI